MIYGNILHSTLLFLGLSQNHQKTYGLGYHQETSRVELLLFRSRMHSRFQHHVHQLLRLQQTRRGRCGDGTNFGETVS